MTRTGTALRSPATTVIAAIGRWRRRRSTTSSTEAAHGARGLNPKGGGHMEQSRREFLKAGAGVAAMAAMPGALAQTPAGWQPSARYPDPTVKVIDPSFNRYKL